MTTPSVDPHARIGELIAGRYRLVQLLGAGGMGAVYEAEQLPLGRLVALKLMRRDVLEHALARAATARFEREARSLASLTHPGIVTLFDFGVTPDGERFMAMEHLRGETLRALLRRTGRLPPDDALSIVREVCSALSAAHRAGIVHRDLKPENIMLVDQTATGGGTRVVKVLDFGIARREQVRSEDERERLTRDGVLMGTPGYMAPEMVLAGVFDDPRSDLYAVGVILWELLTDLAMYEAATPLALVMKHALEPRPSLASLFAPADAPHPGLDDLLSRLLERDHMKRIASAHDVIEAIDALPLDARRPWTMHPLTMPVVARGTPQTGASPSSLSTRPAAHVLASAGLTPDQATIDDSQIAMPTPMPARPTPTTGSTTGSTTGAETRAPQRDAAALLPPGYVGAGTTDAMQRASTSRVALGAIAVLLVIVIGLVGVVVGRTQALVVSPTVAQPVVAQPVVAQPVVTQPVVTQPVVTQPVVMPTRPRPKPTTTRHVPDLTP